MDMSEHRTDPLRRLLDAVLDEESRTLSQMAGLAYTSPFHLSRTVSARSGEAPVALRRRVPLEQAAWRLQRGAAVTETAFASGYDSLEGFTRAFRKAYDHPPTAIDRKSTRLNSSHVAISYAVFCLKKKTHANSRNVDEK